ncbi:Metallo-dependent phosphatase-like protein, partial [Haematococcus lacustris]
MSDADILRIMMTTDNHLGVWEKDEVRKNDSFIAFEEVLSRAVDLNVDMVLLGGDLFHDNKPSRTTVVKTLNLFRKYCLNDRPVPFQILSDQASAFVSGVAGPAGQGLGQEQLLSCVASAVAQTPQAPLVAAMAARVAAVGAAAAGAGANYQDPNLNVGLPVFTIHGNHDDPSGADNLSAVDILSSCGLVNYFGKVNISGVSGSAGKVDLAPILLQKGDTKVALYGLGNIRDERLGRLFNTPGSVTWLQPKDAPGYPQQAWWNLFVLHQNRVQHGPQVSRARGMARGGWPGGGGQGGGQGGGGQGGGPGGGGQGGGARGGGPGGGGQGGGGAQGGGAQGGGAKGGGAGGGARGG